jgi:hypothetical protein
MQRYTIFFVIINALHVPGGFSAHHQEHKNFTHSILYVPGLFAATANSSNSPTLAVETSKLDIPDVVCTVLEVLMMGGETARNM